MSLLKRALGIAAAAASLALIGPAPLAFATTDKDCSDFQYQEDAQAVLNANPSDPYRLDADHDGVACESLPHRTVAQTSKPSATKTSKPSTATKAPTTTTKSGQVSVKPAGGVDTGGGPDSGDGDNGAVWAGGGLLVAGAAAGGVVYLRRRAAR